MPRIRSIKPELFASPQVMNLSHGARLMFIGLITQADDEGRGSADLRKLKAAIFGGDNDVTTEIVSGYLAEVAAQHLAVLYDGGTHGKLYALTGWADHQVINKAKDSIYPKPPSGNGTVAVRERYRGIDRGIDGSRDGSRDRSQSKNPSPSAPAKAPNPRAPRANGTTPRSSGTNPRSTGTNPRALGTNPKARDRSHTAWREISGLIDHIAKTASLPDAQRLTWADLNRCKDLAAVRAAEAIGPRVIADRTRFTASALAARFREQYKALAQT